VARSTQESLMQFETAVQALCDGGVDFVIIGGVAASIQGSALVTLDLDICYSRAPANLHKLAAALAPFHPRLSDLPPGLPFIWDEVTLRNGTVFTLDTDVGRIDLLAEVAGLGSYKEAIARATHINEAGHRFAVLNIWALIDSKRAAGRPKDLRALPELESLAEAAGPEEPPTESPEPAPEDHE
jgi:hypothetical protein